MAGMFLALACWFFYDWKVKYPENAAKYAEWRPVFEEMVLAKRAQNGEPTEASKKGMTDFNELAKSKGWEQNPDAEPTDYPAKIREQLYYGIGASVIGLIILGVFLLNRGKALRADREAIITAWGKRVPFAAVHKVDKRKWDNKWLAYAHYRLPGGKSGRATIDGFIYKDAQAVLDRLLANFSGEVLELAKDDEPAGNSSEAKPADSAS